MLLQEGDESLAHLPLQDVRAEVRHLLQQAAPTYLPPALTVKIRDADLSDADDGRPDRRRSRAATPLGLTVPRRHGAHCGAVDFPTPIAAVGT